MANSNPQYTIEKVEWRFQDTPDTIGSGIIAIGDVPESLKNTPEFDDHIFYYCSSREEFDALKNPANKISDFWIVTEGEV